jgi:hypothetical protein
VETRSSERNTATDVAVTKTASNPHESSTVAPVAVAEQGNAQLDLFEGPPADSLENPSGGRKGLWL